jgi:hypothetical protein
MLKKINLLLYVGLHSACTEEISVAIILWTCILLGSRFEFQHIAYHVDIDFHILQSPLVNASDSTLKQGMTASF